MKVVILCGGMGTRLKEETEFKPKPLVNVGGMPILWHIMKIYSHYGHKEFILPLGYRGEMIKEFFVNFNWMANDFSLDLKDKKVEIHNNHKNEDWTIHFVDTGLESGTALRLYKIKELLKDEEDFMLTYGDGVADIDMNKLVEFHKQEGSVATLTGIQTASRFGVIETDENKVTSFVEKPFGNDRLNGGFFVFNKRIFDHIDNSNVMLVGHTLPKLANTGDLSIYKHDGFWHCMDTYRDYLKLNEIWKNNPKWKIWE